jgi:formate dehydrogenase major subunit
MADMWVPLRAGSDIVFLGALVNHVLEHGLEFREYVMHYTNAANVVQADFRGPDELDGLFSGWDPAARQYAAESWSFEGSGAAAADDPRTGYAKMGGGEPSRAGAPLRDDTLQHPRCVFQILKRHYARYTPQRVEDACGVPREAFRRVADAFCRASGPEKTGAICYAVGWTQHSVGVQIIRTAAILQLLLGNIGRPGGGILALRGHASIQGSTDIPTLFDILPGYLPMPAAGPDSRTLAGYIARHRTDTGTWHSVGAFVVSLLKAWYGDAAAAGNDFGFGWLPRISGDHSHLGYWLDMADRKGPIEGLFVMGQNPAVGAPNARLERRAMANLKWLVVRDMVETETAAFWLDSPEIVKGDMRSADIPTEVFFLPAAAHAEKDGCFTNTQRLLQWHDKAVDAPGDARSDAWFVYHLGRRLKQMALRDRRPEHDGLRALTWDYPLLPPYDEPDIDAVLREINGWVCRERPAEHGAGSTLGPAAGGRLLDGFHALADDGTTACGCWIYSGVYPEEGMNRARRREPRGRYGHGWGFAWPADRRILYNRASARPDGRPWSERKRLVWWDEEARAWTGLDTPDFCRDTPPDYVPPPGARGLDGIAGTAPFIMHADGLGWIWVAGGLKDGPLPSHYEPLESPVANALYAQQTNPAADPKARDDNPYALSPGDVRYPHVLSTYRLTEHHTAGGMSRTLSHLAELQPALFCEISPALAAEVGVGNGSMVTISTPRGSIDARALVTARIPPIVVQGRTIHQVGLPYHFGGRGLVTGDVVNDLVAISQEPNVRIMEAKALVCRVEAKPEAPAIAGIRRNQPHIP